MASFAVASTGTRDLHSILYPSRSTGYGFTEKVSPIICLPERSKARSSLMVKSMGGMAKFKGTQMREKKLTEMIEKKVMEAKEVCEGDRTSDECKVAWDEVEEVSQAKADLRLKLEKEDPLEYFCQDNPETDECRIYDD